MNITYNMDTVGVYGESKEEAFECADSLASASNGKVFLVPDGINILTFTVTPASGATAKVQTSTDIMNTIINGTPEWVDWCLGAVSAVTQVSCYPPTAFRLVQIGTGTAKMSVRAQ